MSVVFITGASGGIGAAITRLFAKSGYQVAIGFHTDFKRAEALHTEIQSAYGQSILVQGDVGNAVEVSRMFDEIETKFGNVSVLINNAGVSHFGVFDTTTDDEWEQVMRVNVTGAFLCCRRVLSGMIRKKEGCIINMSSIWGRVGASCEVAYSTSKAAIIGLTKALAKEEGPSNIRVNCIAPGLIHTEMNAKLSRDELKSFCEATPLGRMGTPEEVALATLFLAENQFVTGQVLGVDGGYV